MRVFIVHAHPEPKSFNGALTRHAVEVLRARGHEVRVSDLYAMGFDPVSSRKSFTTCKDPDFFKPQAEEVYAAENDGFAPELRAEMEKLAWCEYLVFQFPLWWFSLPAILKGWVDRVFAMGFAYGYGRIYGDGVFRGKRALLSLTTGGPEAMYQPGAPNGEIRVNLFHVAHGMFAFTGMTVLPPFVAWSPAHLDEEKREKYLQAYAERLLGMPETEPLAI